MCFLCFFPTVPFRLAIVALSDRADLSFVRSSHVRSGAPSDDSLMSAVTSKEKKKAEGGIEEGAGCGLTGSGRVRARRQAGKTQKGRRGG